MTTRELKNIAIYVYLIVILGLVSQIAVFQYLHRFESYGRLLITPYLSLLVHILICSLILLVVNIILALFGTSSIRAKEINLFIISIFFIWLTAEGLVRISHTVFNYGEKSRGFYLSSYESDTFSAYHVHPANEVINLQSASFHYTRHTNSLGISFPDSISKTPAQGEIRIMALGDSFTEGDGAPSDSTWMKAFERQLRIDYPDQKFCFINAGVCGSDPIFEYRLFQDKLIDYKPDFVILGTNSSDIDDLKNRGGNERFFGKDKCKYKSRPTWESIYAYSNIFRLMVHTRLNYSFLTPQQDSVEKGKAINQIVNSLVEFDKFCGDKGIIFSTLLIPTAWDINVNRFCTLSTIPETLAKSKDLHVINAYEYFKANGACTKNNVTHYFWENDGHDQGFGYDILGKSVADYFVKKHMIDSVYAKIHKQSIAGQ